MEYKAKILQSGPDCKSKEIDTEMVENIHMDDKEGKVRVGKQESKFDTHTSIK